VVIVILFITETILEKSNLREERFIFLTVSEVSVHDGRKGMAEQSSSPHGSQEAETMPVLPGFLNYPLLCHLGPKPIE
jgi:hypothetical protein